MNSKNGFTLVELLAVIIVISIVSTIATVGIIAIRNAINENLLDSKIDIIEDAAVYWGQDYMVMLVMSNIPNDAGYVSYDESYYGYAVVKTVNELADYITAGDTCIDSNDEKYSCVQNNLTGEDMGNDVVYIYVDNNRVYAKYMN